MRSSILSTILLLFALLANPVLPMPMPGPGGNSQVIAGGPSGSQSAPSLNPSKKRPLSTDPEDSRPSKYPKTQPLVTLIDRKGSAKTGITETSDSATITKLLEEAFGVDSLSVDYQGKWEPDTQTLAPKSELRAWIYFTLTNYKDCDPCFGWLARGDRFQMEGEHAKPLVLSASTNELYIGVSLGGRKPARNGFGNSERGKPAIKPGQNAKLTQAMQSEWLNILNEFNARFMDPNFPVQDLRSSKSQKKAGLPLVTCITRKGELIEEGPPVVSTQKIAITAFINRVYSADPDWLPSWKLRQPEYQGQCVPDSQTQTSSWNDREWIYFTLTNYRDCDPCTGWLARGDQVVKSGNSGKQVPQSSAGFNFYGGLVSGLPARNIFRDQKGGRPVDNPPGRSWDRNAVMTKLMQDEWDRVAIEFNERFMNPDYR